MRYGAPPLRERAGQDGENMHLLRFVRVAVSAAFLVYAPQSFAGLAGQKAPALLWIDSSDLPEAGSPVTLELTVASQVEAPASFAIELIAPTGVSVDAGPLSGMLAPWEERTLPVQLVPGSLGDFRLEARLRFSPDGSSEPFIAQNAAVLRVRAAPQKRGIFSDRPRRAQKPRPA